MLLHAADPGMVHTGSSSVTNAKQTKGINARNQNIAALPLMMNPSQQMKREKISYLKKPPGPNPLGKNASAPEGS